MTATEPPRAGYEQAVRFAGRAHGMLIGDQWVPARDGGTLTIRNPADGSVLGHVPAARREDVDEAATAARQAFESPAWRDMPAAARSRILWRIAELIDAHADELAHLETLNNGKPLKAALGVDLVRSAEMLRYMAGWCTKIEGATLPSAPTTGFFSYTRKEPIGVAGLIVPWNYPLNMAADKIAPALAAGCTVVLKPAEETPLSALRLGELALEAGLPPGVLNIVTGVGDAAGAAIAAHPDIDKVSFTGSTEVGRKIMAAAGGNMKRLTLELGGKSPTILLPDADLEAAVPIAAASIFGNAGQVCVAGSRLFVHESGYEQVLDGVLDYARGLRLGSGLTPTTDMGPLVSQRQLERVQHYIGLGQSEGAEIRIGGRRVGEVGYFVEPTVFTGVRDEMAIAQEEIFGPVLSVFRFGSLDELIARANSSRFGLSATVWTSDLLAAHRIAAGLKAGTVWVNNYGAGGPGVPFGGFKQSGWGRERGRDGVEAFLETKSVVVRI